MIILRFLLLAFNVAVIGFLIYKMVDVIQRPIERSRKTIFLVGGVILLLAPIGIFLRFFGATPQYFLIYPIAIFLLLYFTKQLGNQQPVIGDSIPPYNSENLARKLLAVLVTNDRNSLSVRLKF